MTEEGFSQYFNTVDSYVKRARQAFIEDNSPELVIFLAEGVWKFRKDALDALSKGIIKQSDCLLMIMATDRWTVPIPKVSFWHRLRKRFTREKQSE